MSLHTGGHLEHNLLNITFGGVNDSQTPHATSPTNGATAVLMPMVWILLSTVRGGENILNSSRRTRLHRRTSEGQHFNESQSTTSKEMELTGRERRSRFSFGKAKNCTLLPARLHERAGTFRTYNERAVLSPSVAAFCVCNSWFAPCWRFGVLGWGRLWRPFAVCLISITSLLEQWGRFPALPALVSPKSGNGNSHQCTDDHTGDQPALNAAAAAWWSALRHHDGRFRNEDVSQRMRELRGSSGRY